MPPAAIDPEREVPLEVLGETLAPLRLAGPQPLRQMEHSLRHHGQLTALVAFHPTPARLDLIDGFKRLQAARALHWPALRVRVLPADATTATVALALLNEGHGLTDLEQAWLCRALHREHALTQPEIGRRLGRHKSWVYRRLLLAEGLDDTVQADVRLGLLAARSASELARLSRDNQVAAATLVTRRGLTAGQTAALVRAVLACPDAPARAQFLHDALTQPDLLARPATPRRREKTPAEWLLADLEIATRVAARLQVRLRERPLPSFEPRVARLLAPAVDTLRAVLARLRDALDHAAEGRDLRDAVVE